MVIVKRKDKSTVVFIRNIWKKKGYVVTPIKSFPLKTGFMYQFKLGKRK